MAHWAEIDENNIVTRVTVGSNDEPDEGYQWIIDNFGGTWVKTSYNRNIRKNFAGIGYIYDPVADHFFAPQPYPSWILDSDAQWQPPIPMPVEEGKFFSWDEETLSWIQITE